MIKTLGLTFLTTFVISTAAANYFNEYFAKEELKHDAEYLLERVHTSLSEAKRALAEIAILNVHTCNHATQQYLEDKDFQYSAVRQLAITDSEEVICSSVNKNFLDETFTLKKIDQDMVIGSAIDEFRDVELLVGLEQNGLTYYAGLDPIVIDHKVDSQCSNCVGYKMTFNGVEDLILSQPPFDSDASVDFTATNDSSGVEILLEVQGNRAFFSEFRGKSREYAFGFATIAAGVMTIFVRLLLKAHQSIERIINGAIRRREFKPFYQPIVDSRSGKVKGVEVLVRWIRENGEIVPPGDFINFVEDSGQIIEITNQLVEQVGKDLVKFGWVGTDKFASINIVPKHLDNDKFFEKLISVLVKNQLSSCNFSLEITERKKIKSLAQAREVLNRFYKAGFDLKLDDAGTGYGGFSYVQELGITSLKIDKMFIESVSDKNNFRAPVLDAIVSFANKTGLNLIAEGVETVEQVEMLKKLNVTDIQGFYYAKPMPCNELISFEQKALNAA